jgi:hypothetical protein
VHDGLLSLGRDQRQLGFSEPIERSHHAIESDLDDDGVDIAVVKVSTKEQASLSPSV